MSHKKGIEVKLQLELPCEVKGEGVIGKGIIERADSLSS